MDVIGRVVSVRRQNQADTARVHGNHVKPRHRGNVKPLIGTREKNGLRPLGGSGRHLQTSRHGEEELLAPPVRMAAAMASDRHVKHVEDAADDERHLRANFGNGKGAGL